MSLSLNLSSGLIALTIFNSGSLPGSLPVLPSTVVASESGDEIKKGMWAKPPSNPPLAGDSQASPKQNVETINGIPLSEIKHAVEIVCYKLLLKFKFGSHELDDMKQEAYILAIEVLRTEKYDRERPLNTFLYVHIHNRLYNFKRKHWARLTPPCASCALGAWRDHPGPPDPAAGEGEGGSKGVCTPIPWGGYCTRFNDLGECPLYSGWLLRNNAKKSLAGNTEDNYRQETVDAPPLDTAEYLDWIEAQLPPEYIIIWRAYRQGKRVNRTILAEIIAWVQDNVLLTFG